MSLVIGIDPGIKFTGWGVVRTETLEFVAGGCVETDDKHKFEQKIHFLYSELIQVIDMYSPSVCAIEKIFINSNPRSSIVLAQTRGALLLTAKIKNLKIFEFDTNKIKKTITGNGHASKKQVKYMVENILKCNMELAKYDLCDALAAAICYTSSNIEA